MFSLTLRDHLNLTFSQVSDRHKVHTRVAASYRKWHRRLKGCEALMMGGAAVAASGAAFGRGHILAIVAAVFAGIGLILFLIDLTFDFERSAQAHASCSTRLWDIRDRYTSLLSDLSDGVLDVADARIRRDRLMEEVRAAYERTSLVPPGDIGAADVGPEPAPPQSVTKEAHSV